MIGKRVMLTATQEPRVDRLLAGSRILAGFSYRRFPQLAGFFSAAPFLGQGCFTLSETLAGRSFALTLS